MAKAIQIVQPIDDHKFALKIDEFENILNDEKIRDRHVVVISIAGALRQGKSFLLNFLLHYLQAQYKSKDVTQFLSKESIDLTKGFKFCGGSTPNTTGIWIWSEIFTHNFKNGENIAIILMDTQGAFDTDSSIRDCSTIFALSTLLSSIQCYNVMRNIREDDLQHLHLFTEYGKIATKHFDDENARPFQHLLFLIRDWPYAYECSYGWKGGQDIVYKRLLKTNKQTNEMQKLRDQLCLSFTDIRGFLMPYPGDAVGRSEQFDGNLKNIDDKFIDMVKELLAKILAPENLIVKQVNGENIRAKDIVQYLKSYINVFNSSDLPDPKSIFDVTVDSYNLIAYNDAKSKYVELMEKAIQNISMYFTEKQLILLHSETRETCVKQFESKPKLGGNNHASKYLKKLLTDIDTTFSNYKIRNEEKKKVYMASVEIKCEQWTKDAIFNYKSAFTKEFTSYLDDDKMKNLHLTQKNAAIKLFESKMTMKGADFDDIKQKFRSQLEKNFEMEFIEFQVKNKEKKVALEKAEAESRKILNMNSMENALRYLNSSRYSPSPSYGYCSPSPSCSSSGSSGRRVNYTPSENKTMARLISAHGRDISTLTREFNKSSSCSTPRNESQIRSKYYRMTKK